MKQKKITYGRLFGGSASANVFVCWASAVGAHWSANERPKREDRMHFLNWIKSLSSSEPWIITPSGSKSFDSFSIFISLLSFCVCVCLCWFFFLSIACVRLLLLLFYFMHCSPCLRFMLFNVMPIAFDTFKRCNIAQCTFICCSLKKNMWKQRKKKRESTITNSYSDDDDEDEDDEPNEILK